MWLTFCSVKNFRDFKNPFINSKKNVLCKILQQTEGMSVAFFKCSEISSLKESDTDLRSLQFTIK